MVGRSEIVMGQHASLLDGMSHLLHSFAERVAVIEGMLAKQPVAHDISTPPQVKHDGGAVCNSALQAAQPGTLGFAPSAPAKGPDHGDAWHTGPDPWQSGNLSRKFDAAAPVSAGAGHTGEPNLGAVAPREGIPLWTADADTGGHCQPPPRLAGGGGKPPQTDSAFFAKHGDVHGASVCPGGSCQFGQRQKQW